MEKPVKKKQLIVGDNVIKAGGEYKFSGIVVAVFRKLGGQVRYVVENDDGMPLIFKPTELVSVEETWGADPDNQPPETAAENEPGAETPRRRRSKETIKDQSEE